MSFLYPAFLWGLLAVAIPLAIHLFNFRKTKTVLFTNVAFLREIETQKSAFRKLKHLLILAARMLMLACLAVAFAQPFRKEQAQAPVQGITSFYLDNSFSMQNENNNKRFIDNATGSLDELMSVYPNLTSLQLVTNDFAAGEHSLLTASALQDRLTTTELTPGSRTLQAVYDRQVRLLEQARGRTGNELFWISDFQKSTSGDLAKVQIDSSLQLNLVPIQTRDLRNVYVDSVWLETPFLRAHQRNVLNVRVVSSGTEPVENLPVRLILNDTQVSASSADIAANGSVNLAFDFSLNDEGYVKGMVTFDDFPVTFDNQYYFVLNASPVLRILHLHSGTRSAGDPVNRVYRNDSLFALSSINADNIDIGQLESADLVVLNEVDRPSASLMAGLVGFVRAGGSLLIVPSLRPDESSLKGYLEQLGVFGAVFQPSESVPLNEPEAGIPFFRDVFEASVKSDAQVNMPAAANVWSWSNAGSVLLSLRNGVPFLSQVTSGKGKLYLLGAPLDPGRSNFAQHAVFVPVMYRIAALSVKPRPVSYSFEGRSVELRVGEVQPNTVFKLKYGESELIPAQRLVGNLLTFEMPKKADLPGQNLEAGYFELITDGQTENLMAFNTGKAESSLSYYPPQELREIFAGYPNVRVFDEIDDSGLKSKFDQKASGTRLWKYFLYAALFFLLAEILMVRFMKD